jgi:hypothetical protein
MDLAGCFLKFGELSHMLDLQKKGILYCNPIGYFTEIDDGNLRGDDMEDVTEMMYMESGIVLLGKPEREPGKDGIEMPFKNANFTGRIAEPFGNLFCMYTMNFLEKENGHQFTVDLQMKKFGDYFLLIHKPHEFLQRVKKAAEEMKLAIKGDFVNYLNLSKYTGKKSVFQKDIIYNYQNEYRVFINNKKSHPIILEIGNIEDISILCESEELQKLIIAGYKKNSSTFTILSNLKIKNRIVNY